MSEKTLDKLSNEFGTPDYIFKPLDRRYIFTLDAAASAQNTKCAAFFTKEDNALIQPWDSHRVWCNPPYSKMPNSNKGFVDAFVRKAFEETAKFCELAVLLVPTKTEQDWFGELKNSGRVEINYINHRIRFIGGATSGRDSHMILTIWPPLEFLQ